MQKHGVLEPIDDIDIPSTSRYSCNARRYFITRTFGFLSNEYVRDDIIATLTWVLNGYGETNVTVLTRHVGAYVQIYSFERSIALNKSGYVYVDGENLMFPEDDIPWNADTLMQLVANVRGLYAKKADDRIRRRTDGRRVS
jgi:hypothetical protein